MRTETRKVYVTDDGTEFLNKKEAAEHEMRCKIYQILEPLCISPSSCENNEARSAAADIIVKNLGAIRAIMDSQC